MPSEHPQGTTAPDLTAEQQRVDRTYRRLDALRERTAARLAEVLARRGLDSTGLMERDVDARMQSERLAAFEAAEAGLVVGRLDRREVPEPLYVGRVGLSAENGDGERMLVDWRAPAARPFYVATPAQPLGVVRRRHIRTSLRTVTGLSDELLDLSGDTAVEGLALTGESALLAALGAARTGRMTDIVRTIQAEQDAVIRADARGVLVVQGGPGTGKTAVALHRVAYLLYTHRERLARSGVLVVGPTPAFLRYIADVLPSLGETGVLLSGLGQLRPGLDAGGEEPAEVAALKGRTVMADVLAAAVRDRQAVPDAPVEVEVEGVALRFTRRDGERARTAARRAAHQHNPGRPAFAANVVATLTRRYADALSTGLRDAAGLLEAGDLADIRREVAATPAVSQLVDRLWPRLTPERLVAELFAAPERIAAATPDWDDADRQLLHRPRSAPWTPADVPLLEEADELLGTDDSAERASERRRRRVALARAQDTLDVLHGSRSTDVDDDEEGEELTAADVLDAAGLAERAAEADLRTAAERAATDRTWTFGHVVVDEAQELSPMAWRLLLRRCPTRSMTVVGDVAQTGSLGGADSWAAVLDPLVGRDWRLAELTVNYRTPAEIMAVAGDVLAAAGGGPAPDSVRSTGEPPWVREVADADLPAAVADAVGELVGADGTLAVVVPAARREEVAAAVRARIPGTQSGPGADSARGPLVAAAAEVKGLEFDSVLVADPQGLLDGGPRGAADLYVALTRATRRLGVLAPGPLPESLHRLRPRP